ncbi:GCN5-related N-acetyltransferase 7, chloroplastic-like isoform X1 [Tasmannia lanceolata]|uniref:GCN5-related N-acetyltransferase 7, chloroplastic-like isoform X1 n=1 Tax=Tasmannia lanceolata TaxID=3420 RepID=UPI00406352C8
MALITSSVQWLCPPSLSNPDRTTSTSRNYKPFPFYPSARKCPNSRIFFSGVFCARKKRLHFPLIFSQLCTEEALTLERNSLIISEAVSDEELWATATLRVRSFYDINQTYSVEDHKGYLAEREFEALKDRISGKRIGFKRVSCINATLPLSQLLSSSDEFCSACKFSENGEDRVVVGTLDLNQCLRLADEITGTKPEGIGADFARAYLSNVCVAKELHRNGVGYALVSKSKKIARGWGITDLYSHVAVDNEAAKKLYMKCGFVYESDEPAWQARFLGRPRRFLLWADLTTITHNF